MLDRSPRGTPLIPGSEGALSDDPASGYQNSVLRLALAVFSENRLALVGVSVIVFFVLFCVIGPLIYRTDQLHTNLANATLSPGPGHLLGTNELGFDELGRIMVGGRASLEIAFSAALIATTIGTLWGAIAGIAGRVVDGVMMRIVDLLLSVPFLFVLLIVATFAQPAPLTLALLIGSWSWLTPARLVRSEVISLKEREFVAASRVMGAPQWWIITRHLIPNAIGTIVVNITFQVGDAIILVAALGFLGFGLSFPNVDWGDMLSQGVTYLLDGYWWLIFPVGAALTLVIMAFNLVGDAIRDSLDVRLQRR